MRDHLPRPTLSLATARAAVCDPGCALAYPWNTQDAWFALKEAQGHPISRERLAVLLLTAGAGPAVRARVAAVTGGDADDHVAVQIAPHLARAAQAVCAIIARRTGPTGGDAA